jgi:hypothetical protein
LFVYKLATLFLLPPHSSLVRMLSNFLPYFRQNLAQNLSDFRYMLPVSFRFLADEHILLGN